MNRCTTRISAVPIGLAISGLLVAAALAGCGAGQITQTSTQEPAVNGTSGRTNDVTLRNVHIQAVQTGDALQPGETVALMLIATNDSLYLSDKLVEITSDVGAVTVSGDPVLPANGSLVVGTPDGQDAAQLHTVENADSVEAIVALTKPISNGLTYDFTFDFERAGKTTLSVPISAGDAPRQGGSDESAEHS